MSARESVIRQLAINRNDDCDFDWRELEPVRRFGPGVSGTNEREFAAFSFVTTLYIFANAGLRLFVATIARNLAQVGLLSLLILAPIILLSGTWTPPEAMPTWLRLATTASPLRHHIDASYGILLKGAGLDLLADSIFGIGLLGGSILAFGVWRF